MTVKLNHLYSTKEVAELLNINYKYFCNKKEQFEQHLKRFYDFDKIIRDGKLGTHYIFYQEYSFGRI